MPFLPLATKGIEEARQIVRFDAHTAVLARRDDLGALARAPRRESSARLGAARRIGEQVDDHLRQTRFVAVDQETLGGNVDLERVPSIGHQRERRLDRIARGHRELDRPSSSAMVPRAARATSSRSSTSRTT